MLKRCFNCLLLTGTFCCSAAAWADAGNEALFEVQFTGYARGNQGSSLLATQIYAEQPLPVGDVAAFLVVHHDRDFDAAYVGLARKFGDLQLGIGLGNAWYEGIRHPTVNPWLYYGSYDAEAYLSVEHYARDDRAPWFCKGYASRRIVDSLFIGAYGEKGLGAGPMVAWSNGNIRIWAAVPVVDRKDGGARGVVGVQVVF